MTSRFPLKIVKDLLVLQDKPSKLKNRIPPGLKNQLKIYKYNIWLLYADLSRTRQLGFRAVIAALRKKRKRVVFFPDPPWQNAVIYQICLENGYRIAHYPCQAFDFAIKWKNDTSHQMYPVLHEISKTHPVINLNCNDISKSCVDAAFQEIFGYGISIDPTSYHGKCVEKSIFNGRHDATIIDCPIAKAKPHYVYQLLVDNRIDDERVMDMRVPIFKDRIPFVIVFYKPVDRRFANFHFHGDNYQFYDTDRIFSPQEQANILFFCCRLGMDYGELDILRHRPDGRIFIVDANNTPDGPPISVGLDGNDLRTQTLHLRAEAFAEVFDHN